MSNLLAATEIASIFLDTHLCIKRFTPAAAGIVKLIRTDIGRSLDDLKTSFPRVDLAGLSLKVLTDLNTISAEILTKDGIWYSLRVLPYRTNSNVIEGVVMTFININEIKKAGIVKRLATILEDSNDAIVMLDFKGQITAWNKGAQNMYGYTEPEALLMNYQDLFAEDHPASFKEIVDKLNKGEQIRSLKCKRRTKGGDILDIWLTATVLLDESGRSAGVAVTERNLDWLP